LGRKIGKTAIIVDKNRKAKTKLEETSKTAQDTKTEKPQFLSAKTNKNWPNLQNQKSQRLPHLVL